MSKALSLSLNSVLLIPYLQSAYRAWVTLTHLMLMVRLWEVCTHARRSWRGCGRCVITLVMARLWEVCTHPRDGEAVGGMYSPSWWRGCGRHVLTLVMARLWETCTHLRDGEAVGDMYSPSWWRGCGRHVLTIVMVRLVEVCTHPRDGEAVGGHGLGPWAEAPTPRQRARHDSEGSRLLRR